MRDLDDNPRLGRGRRAPHSGKGHRAWQNSLLPLLQHQHLSFLRTKCDGRGFMLCNAFVHARSKGCHRDRNIEIREVIHSIHPERAAARVPDSSSCGSHFSGHQLKRISATGPGAAGHRSAKFVPLHHLVKGLRCQNCAAEQCVQNLRCGTWRAD